MDEFLRLACCGNEIEPAAGDVHLRVKREDAVGERVAMVVVVEEPRVDGGVAKCGLDCGDVHGGILSPRLLEWEFTTQWRSKLEGTRCTRRSVPK